MQPQKARSFPIELFELIIDFVDDEKALQSTSLVCKAWLPRSRFNLFRTIELNLPEHLDNLLDLLASTPEIAPVIQELSISENSVLAVLRPAMSIVARFPFSLSSHPLVQVRRLIVHRQLWLPTHYSSDYLLELSQFTSITFLDLVDVSFTTVADFSIVLRGLAHIESLHLAHLDCQRQLDLETSAAIGYQFPFLKTLRVVANHPTSPIDWFLAHNTFPSLRDVDISYELSATAEPHQALGALWTSTGSTIESVTLSISKRSIGSRLPLEVIEKQLDMSHCTALRTLRFDCRNEREFSPDWTWLVWLLRHLSSASLSHGLRNIVLAFQHSSHALASLHAFAGTLDEAISGASLVFEFDYWLAFDEDPDEQALLEKFPELCSRNRLGVRRAHS